MSALVDVGRNSNSTLFRSVKKPQLVATAPCSSSLTAGVHLIGNQYLQINEICPPYSSIALLRTEVLELKRSHS